MSVEPARQSEREPAPQERYFNRELSWLKFNERVLEEAANTAHPLLERLKFLAISGDNLDEFYMVRVAGLVGQVEEGVDDRSPDGLSPAQTLAAVLNEGEALMRQQQSIWSDLHGESRRRRDRGADARYDRRGRTRMAGALFPRPDLSGADAADD